MGIRETEEEKSEKDNKRYGDRPWILSSSFFLIKTRGDKQKPSP